MTLCPINCIQLILSIFVHCHCFILLTDLSASRAMQDGHSLLDEMSRPIKNAFGKDISPDYANQIKHVNQRLEELQERKMRCDDLAEVRKLKLQQILQLRTCEKDAEQVCHI